MRRNKEQKKKKKGFEFELMENWTNRRRKWCYNWRESVQEHDQT